MMAKKTKPVKLGDLALGSYEAACVLGVHFTQPARMAEKGLLTTASATGSPKGAGAAKAFAVYSLDECQRDYEDYEERRRQPGPQKRARTMVDERGPMLKRLAALEHQITFADAIGTLEAAEILGVHFSFPPRLAAEGKIIGRVLINDRRGASRVWIFSRASCQKNAATTRRLEEKGAKRGRPRRRA
jgi:hypothetical protein